MAEPSAGGSSATTIRPLPLPSEAASDPVAAALPAGARVGHLTIERVLHEGPHTIVYRARDLSAPQVPALALMEYFPRVLALRQPDGSLRARQASDAIALSVGREAFVLEASSLESVLHPGVVRVVGSLQANRTVYRAMELVTGPTLERFVSERDAPPHAGEVAALLDALLDALQALHGAGVLHGQVRPDQVLMTADRRPVLLGMGSAAAEIAHHAVGPWSAPEQPALSRHDRITSATDIYLAAATTWFFATGEQPPPLRERLEHPEYWDPSAALAKLADADSDAPGLKRRLCVALAAALALDPTERPQRVADLRRLLSPGIAPAPFQSQTTPLWVGPMPDRDMQWLGPAAAAPALRLPAGPRVNAAPVPPRSSAPPVLSPARGADDLPPFDPAWAAQAARDDDTRRVRPAPGRSRVSWSLWVPLLVAGAALAWWLQRERLDLPPAAIDSITGRATSVPAPSLPAASAALALPAPPTHETQTAPAPQATEPLAAAPGPAPTTTAAVPPPVAASSAPMTSGAAPEVPVGTPQGAGTPQAPVTTQQAPVTTQQAPVTTQQAPVATQATPVAPPPPAVESTPPAPATAQAPTGALPRPEPADAAPPERPVATGPARASAPRRTATPTPTAPRELCSGRTQFSLVYCLQEVCSRPGLRYHAQCIELRRNGDIR